MAPTFVDYIIFSGVRKVTPEEAVEGVAKAVTDLTSLTNGALVSHVGKAYPILREESSSESIVFHVRVTEEFLELHSITAEDLIMRSKVLNAIIVSLFEDHVVVRLKSEPIGLCDPDFTAFQFGAMKYKRGTTQEAMTEVKEIFAAFPSRFPKVQQVTFGENCLLPLAPDRRPAGDRSYNVGFMVGFTSVQDLTEFAECLQTLVDSKLLQLCESIKVFSTAEM